MPRSPLRRRALAALLALSALGLPAAADAAPYVHTTQPVATGGGGAAATVDSVATAAATRTLREGGNAVDAAVAAAAVLGVTEPFSAGIGGGGFMVIRTPQGKVTTIDSRETAPAAMATDAFFEGGEALGFAAARYSGLSAGVPGTVAGWDRALRRYGSRSFREVLRPAIDVARRGFVVDETFASQTTPNLPYFDDLPATRALYVDPDGTARDVGSAVRNPGLARTYSRIARLGAERGFYRGPVAEAIVRAVRRPPTARTADKVWRPGVMTEEDVRRYFAPERRPTKVGYRGLDVYSMGPPSSGGPTVGEALNILEGLDLSGLSRTEALHRFLEASALAFADRNAYVADPAFFDVPLCGLLSDGFAATRRALIGETAATKPVAPGDPYPFDEPCDAEGRGAAIATATGGTTTTHLVTSDAQGTVVSYTFTIESTGGNGIVVPGFGFLLNNELTDFNFDSLTHPNRVEGGKRPRSSMAPTYVERDGEPFLAVGSPGGSTIITTVLQVLLERIDLGRDLPGAIAAPRAAQRNTASVSAEPAFIAQEGPGLTAKGHTFTDAGEIGAATGLEFLPDGRTLAAAEPVRRGGGAAGVVTP
jgi:gamma-glutamyltranspeptidase/glutathione hydrolase